VWLRSPKYLHMLVAVLLLYTVHSRLLLLLAQSGVKVALTTLASSPDSPWEVMPRVDCTSDGFVSLDVLLQTACGSLRVAVEADGASGCLAPAAQKAGWQTGCGLWAVGCGLCRAPTAADCHLGGGGLATHATQCPMQEWPSWLMPRASVPAPMLAPTRQDALEQTHAHNPTCAHAGPYHFMLNDKTRIMGSSVRRQRALRRRGILEASVPYYEWMHLESWTEKVLMLR